ncbi:hydantoinase B/oxoprolinase family protein [Verticiella sediminum]|uniref:Hydantoinase B/oxoprolinase family protein n=1 Tax=Verticiella sediminum TaxID=1247510 RepID=A0A556AMS8_9BURK|nr:hydantoinase B/oxoprolinase family protein [Verticiella sediminum]TSH94190.1 hydantoinase B/oxoprolinase family protein [Verticiella sediminum]
MNETVDGIDAITLEIWWSRLVAVVDEGATALLRTAFSTIVRESNDFATVLMNVRGESIAESSGGIPAFAGIIPRTARAMLRKFPLETWREGDCVLTNDPWIATGHLPDITVVTPVFYQGRIVGFAGCAAHSPDVGGNLSATCRDLFEEGVCISPMHLYRAGERNEPFLELFLNNVRLPEQVLGDLEAQCTANRVCCERAVDFLQDSGEPGFERLSAAVLEKADAAMRKAISAIPDGRYASAIEADGIPGHPTIIRCAITVEGDRMTVDYEGTSAQVDKGTNCTINYTQAYSVYPIKCALDPLTRRNEGSYRAIEVRAPEGSIVNAQYPAAVAARHLTGHLLSCAIYQALSTVIPEQVIADSGGAPAFRVGFAGVTDAGERFGQILFASGGMGASARQDGLSATAFPTNSGAGSIEALEAAAPLLLARKEYRQDSGGPGRFRGGLGQECVVRNLAARPVVMGMLGDRQAHPALGLHGGLPGAPAQVILPDGSCASLKSQTTLAPGARAVIRFAGGGGFGDPAARPAAAVAADVADGFVSREQARSVHPQFTGFDDGDAR